MEAEFKRQIALHLDESMRKLEVAWPGLSEEQVWWRPNEHCLAPANQLIHLTGNLRQYVGTALCGLAPVRTRDAEFAAREGPSKDALYAAFVEQFAFAKTRLAAADDLLAEHLIQGKMFTEVGVWVHVTEHVSYHTGQLIYAAKALRDAGYDFYGGWAL